MQFSTNDLAKSDVNCLAMCLYQEARGEPETGKYWVGHVVLNRVKNKQFPNTVHGVVFQKSQFSWTIGNSNFTVKETAAWEKCVDIARELLSQHTNNTRQDPTGGALYFLSGGIRPSWSRKLRVTGTIGGHRFLA